MKPTDYTKLVELPKDKCPVCGGKIKKVNESKFIPFPDKKKENKP